jgi:formylglycine-generating enzyme required for sulfatase activity
VVNVTWNDSVRFCEWLSRKEGVTYRLPTEAEWEYSCRAGTTTRYHNGDDPDLLPEVGRVSNPKGYKKFPHIQEMEIPEVDPDSFTVPVGRYKPNAFGLYDMHGNAWEWCSDWQDDDYYARSPLDDPQGPEISNVRVRRGGGWNTFPIWARASFRNFNTPVSRICNLGFRVVRQIPVSDSPARY